MRLEFRTRSIRLLRPTDPDRLLEDPEVLAWNRRDDYMPYWAYLWPGAFLLAEAVAAEDWKPGLRALELGCGLGLAGLVGLSAGLERVDFTDYDLAPLRYVAQSAAINGFGDGRYSAELLDWRQPPDERYPVILGADVLYEKPLVPLVLGVLDRMLAPDGVAMVAGPYRVASEDLTSKLAAAGFVSTHEPISSRNERGERVSGTLHRIRRRADG